MRKIALMLSVAAAMVAAFGVVPAVAAAKKHDKTDDRDGGAMTTSASSSSADGNGNGISNSGHRAEAMATEYDGGSNRLPVGYDASAGVAEPVVTGKHSSKQHNAKLLNKLGMKRVRTGGGGGNGANHHRKRLASQSRSKYGADGKGAGDSQMFIVKLPPHAHFYDDGSAAAVHQRLQHKQQQQHKQTLQPYNSLNTVPVGFVSNGKPAKVYHWNLPTIKHALKGGGSRYKMQAGGNDVVIPMHHQQFLQYSQPGDFEIASGQATAGSKIVPRRTLYYKPRAAGKPVKKSFVNNGKPNGFYVVSTKNAAAVPQYHKIVKAYYGNGDD